MFNKRVASQEKPKILPKKPGDPQITKYMGAAVVVLLLFVGLIVGLITLKLEVNQLKMNLGKAEAKYQEATKPIYNLDKDLLTDQCDQGGTYCLSVQTPSPSLEMLKFLVSFRETRGLQYKMIFEVKVGGNETLPYKLSCNGDESEFYICQEIVAMNPTDVIRNFAHSYKALSTNGTYGFNLMVKPIGRVELMQPVRIQPPPEAKPIQLTETPVPGEAVQTTPVSEPVAVTESLDEY